MKFLAVSTFNADGLDLYGLKMMETFHLHWPAEVELRVYSEGWEGDVDLLDASPWLSDFKARHKDKPTRDYRMDAVRFSHKVAAVCHAAREDVDVLIWLDGDVVTHAPVTVKDLESLAPKGGEWIAWLDRHKSYPECGLYMLNCRHASHLAMIDAFESMYTDGHLFGLSEWHDSYVLEQVVRSASMTTKSLSGPGRFTNHPMINGPLGTWFDHCKGRRKQAGRSPVTDLVRGRPEPYWT